jgi:hypothetical protein
MEEFWKSSYTQGDSGGKLMFRWPCIMVLQYSEINVKYFLFNLLRNKGLYAFRALIANPQEALTNGTWYIACMLRQLAAHGAYQCISVKDT